MLAALEGGADIVAAELDAERLNPGWVARSRPLGRDQGLNDHLGFLPFATSSCLGIRRDPFLDLGGFGELRTGEDIDLCWRAQLAGLTIAVAEGACLHYRLRDARADIFRQAVGYGRATPALYRRYRAEGMPRPSVRSSARAVRHAVRSAVRGSDRAERAAGTYLLGLAVGRAVGSVEQRVRYL